MVAMGVYVFAHCAWQVMSVIQRICVASDTTGDVFPTLYTWSDFHICLFSTLYSVLSLKTAAQKSFTSRWPVPSLAQTEINISREMASVLHFVEIFFLTSHFSHIFDHYGHRSSMNSSYVTLCTS